MKMAVGKDANFTAAADDTYVVIDLPVRFTSDELAHLTLTANHMRTHDGFVAHAIRPISIRHAAARAKASALLDLRKRREESLGAALFADPAWDILLDLFVRHIDGSKTSTTRLRTHKSLAMGGDF